MKTIIKQAIELLERQRKELKKDDILGLLFPNEFVHKSNQINSTQLLLSGLIPIEEKQMTEYANQSKWISVEKELPKETEKGVKVIAVIDNTKAKQRVYGNVCELIYYSGKFHVGFNKGYIQNDVTHWQYQPTFP